MASWDKALPRWAWINGALFVAAHALLFFGLFSVFDSFVALTASVIVGLLAYAAYRFRPEWWRSPVTTLVLAGVIAAEWGVVDKAVTPPPPPEPLALRRMDDGTYRLNRGGKMQFARVYLVIPEPEESRACPPVLGAVRVIDPLDDHESRVTWIVLRKPYAGRERYRVRPLRPGETPPSPSKYATLTAGDAPGRVVLDVGRAEGVKVDQVYALYHPGGRGRAGYAVVDKVFEHASEAYLAVARPKFPHDADRIGVLRNVLQYVLTRAEVAFLSGDTETARREYRAVLELSRGTNERAEQRLAALDTHQE